MMQVKIVYDPYEYEYIAFIEGITSISGYGQTEKEAIVDFLHQCEKNPKFHQSTIQLLLSKIQ
jgi:hypothetical protein